MAKQELQVQTKEQNVTPKDNLSDAKLKNSSSSSSGERKEFQKELSKDSKPKTVTQKVQETNRRIEDDVILNSNSTAKQTGVSNTDNQRRVIENNQINQNLTAPTGKKKRRLGSRLSLRLAKAGLAKFIKVDEVIDDLQEDVRGNSDNLAAIEAAEEELATRLKGEQIAELVTSQTNEIEAAIAELQQQNLSEDQIKFVTEKYERIVELAEEIAKTKYSDDGLDQRKLTSLEESRNSEIAKLQEMFSKYPFLEEPFLEAKQEVEDYYALKFIQERIHGIARRKASSDVMQYGSYARNSEISRKEWTDFKEQITREILHRRPELSELVDEIWDKAYKYEYQHLEKGKEVAETIYAKLRGGIDYDGIFYALNKLDRASFLAMRIHYQRLARGRDIDTDFDKRLSNYSYLCYNGNRDSVLRITRQVRSRRPREYEGINIDGHFSVSEKKDIFERRIRAKAFSIESTQLTLALRGKSSFADALTSLASRSESSRNQIKNELKQVYGEEFTGISEARQKLLEKAFNGTEITEEELINLALEEFSASGALHGKLLATPEFTSSGLSIDLSSIERDFARLMESNPRLKQIFMEAYRRSLNETRSEEILFIYGNLLANERRLEGINGNDLLKRANEAREKQRAYLASQQNFISENTELANKIKQQRTDFDRQFARDKRNLGRAAREIYDAGSNYRKVRSIIINLNSQELHAVSEAFKDYGLTLEQHITRKFSDSGVFSATNYRRKLLDLISNRREAYTESPRRQRTANTQTVDTDLMNAARECVNGNSLESDLLILNRSLQHPLGAIRLKKTLSTLSEEDRKKLIEEFEKRYGSIEKIIKERYQGKGLEIALASINGQEIEEKEVIEHVQVLLALTAKQYAECMATKQHISANESLLQVNEILGYVKNKQLQQQLLQNFNQQVRQGYSEYLIHLLIQNSYRRGIEEGKSSSHIDRHNLSRLRQRRAEILEEHKTFIDSQPEGFLEQLEKQEKIAFEKGTELATTCHKKVMNMDHACNGNGGWGTDEDKLFANMRASSPEERALIQELYKLHVGHSVQYELHDELSGYYLDKGEALMRGDTVGELAAEAALALNSWWGINPDEGRTIRALETLQSEALGVEGADLRKEFLEVFNEVYAPDFGKETFEEVSNSSFNEEERAVRQALLEGDPRSVAVVRLRFAKKENIAVELEKLILDPITGEISKENLEQLHSDLELSDDETVEEWIKDRFRDTSMFSVEGFDYNYMKWALALVDGKENGHLRARAHKINYAIKGMGTNEAFIEEACSSSPQLVMLAQSDAEGSEEAKAKIKSNAEFIRNFYTKEYKGSGFEGDGLKNDLEWDLTGVLVEVELYRLEHGYLSEAQKLKHAIGNDDLNAAMAILQGKTTSEIKALEKELLDSTEAKGMWAGEYDSLEELITSHFSLDDERQLTIELIGMPDTIPVGKLNEEGKAVLDQIEQLTEARYENARRGIDLFSDLLTSTAEQLEQETNEIRRILAIARNDESLSQEHADRLKILIQRQGMLSTSHCEAAASLGDTASNYVAGAVVIVGVVATSVFSGGTAVPIWAGILGTAAASIAARQGTRSMFVGTNTFSDDNMIYDGGMGSLDGLTFGIGSGTTSLIGNKIYTEIGKRALALEVKLMTEAGETLTREALERSVVTLGESIVEKTFIRRLGMRSLEGMADGTINGYLHSATTTAFNERTWDNGFFNGLLVVNQNGALGGSTGFAMGGTLAMPFAFVKPPVVKMSQAVSPEQAMRGGLLERIGIEDTFLNSIGRRIGLSRNKMSEADVLKALETKGIVTKGDVEIARLNGRTLSDRQASKLFNSENLTPDQLTYFQNLHREGALTELHLAQVNGVAPTYFVDVNPDVLRVRQIELENSGFNVKVQGAEAPTPTRTQTGDDVQVKVRDGDSQNTRTSSSEESSTPNVTPSRKVEDTPSVKSDEEFLEILTERGISEELKGFIESGHINTIEKLDNYLASPMGLEGDINIVSIVKRQNETGSLRNNNSSSRSENVRTDNDNGSFNNDAGSGNSNGNGDGDFGGNGSSGRESNNRNTQEVGDDGSVMVMDDIAREEQALAELFEPSASSRKQQSQKRNSDSENPSSNNSQVKTDTDLLPNRALTEQESQALSELVHNDKALSDFVELGRIRGDKKINDSDISAFELEDFIASRLISADDLPEPLKHFANRRFNSEQVSTKTNGSRNRGANDETVDIEAEALLAKLKEVRQRVEKISNSKKEALDDANTPEFDTGAPAYKDQDTLASEAEIADIMTLSRNLDARGNEIKNHSKNSQELDQVSLKERYREIDEALDEIKKALDIEESGFTSDLFDSSPYSANDDMPFFDADGGGGAGLQTQKRQSELQAVADRVSSKISSSREVKPKPAKPTTETSSPTRTNTEIETPSPRVTLNTDVALQLSLRTGLQSSVRNSLRHSNSPAHQPAKQKSSAPTRQNSIPKHVLLSLKTKPGSPKNRGRKKPHEDFNFNPSKTIRKEDELSELLKQKEDELASYGDEEFFEREHDPSAIRYKVVTIKGNIYRQRYERSTQASSNDQWIMTYSQLIGRVEDENVA